MGTLLKPQSVGLSRLTNGRYSAFMNRVADLASAFKEEDAAKLTMLPSFKETVALMTDLFNQSLKYSETPELHQLNEERLNAFRRLATLLTSFKYATADAEKKAYNKLSTVFAPYTGTPYLAIEDASASILGLVFDFSKAENTASVTALKLTDYVTVLDTANKAFIEKYCERQASKKAKEMKKTEDVRPKLDSLYDDLVNTVFAANVLAPSADLTNFLNALNSYIVEMRINMNVSAGLRAAAKKRKAEKEKTDGKTDGGATTGGSTTGGTTGNGSTSGAATGEGTTGGSTNTGATGGGSTDSGNGSTTGGNTDTGGAATGGSSGGTGKEDLPVGDA